MRIQDRILEVGNLNEVGEDPHRLGQVVGRSLTNIKNAKIEKGKAKDGEKVGDPKFNQEQRQEKVKQVMRIYKKVGKRGGFLSGAKSKFKKGMLDQGDFVPKKPETPSMPKRIAGLKVTGPGRLNR